MEKKALRKEVLKLRDAVTVEEREKAAGLITEKIASHPWFKESTHILLFISYDSEIDTRGILEEALRQEKKVFVPKVVFADEKEVIVPSGQETGKEEKKKEKEKEKKKEKKKEKEKNKEKDKVKEIQFYRIQSYDELVPGYKGIPEPSEKAPLFDYGTLDGDERRNVLLLMPGVAFDKENHRLGYGGGFYDRYLADKEELRMRSIAIGFRCQLVENVPHTVQDRKPCQVIVV